MESMEDGNEDTTQRQAGLIIYGVEGMGFVWSLKGSWPQPRALNVACPMRRDGSRCTIPRLLQPQRSGSGCGSAPVSFLT